MSASTVHIFDDVPPTPMIQEKQEEEKKDDEPENLDCITGVLQKFDEDEPLLYDFIPFPLDALNIEVIKIIEDIKTGFCVDYSLVFGPLLSLAATCIGGSRGVICSESHGWTELANLYLLTVAKSGASKTPVTNFIFSSLLKEEARAKAEWKEQRAQYEIDLAAWKKIKEPEGPAPERPKNIQYLLDDATIEAAVERLEDNERGLLWHKDEFAGFFQGLERYNAKASGTAKQILLSAWSAHKISCVRKTKDGLADEKYIEKGVFSIYGNIQPALLRTVFNMHDINQGFPQRFIFMFSEAFLADTVLPEIPLKTRQAIEKITKKLLSLEMIIDETGRTEAEYLKISDDAHKALFAFFEMLKNAAEYPVQNELAASYMVKWKSMTYRLALIFHLLNWAVSDQKSYEKEIGVEPVNQAIAIMHWLSFHIRQAHNIISDVQNEKDLKNVRRPETELLKTKIAKAIKELPADQEHMYTLDEIIQKLQINASKTTVGTVLQDFGIKPKQVREGDARVRKYNLLVTDKIKSYVTS